MFMNHKLFLICSVAVVTSWASPSFAVRQTAVGAGTTPLNTPTGGVFGVDMTGGAGTGTLTVGTQDIFSSNTALATSPPAVSTDASSTSNITFNGNSTVYGDIGTAGAFFLNIAATNGTTVNFLGTVFTTTMNVGTGTVNFDSGTITNIGATNFTGDGTISLAPNTHLTGALTTNTADTGTLDLGGGSQLTGAVGGANGLKAINVLGGSNTAGVSATINGATQAYSFSLGTNTLNVTGALKIDNPGPDSINTTLASPTVYGHIIPTGFATLPATLGINVLVPSTAYIPVGSLFNIVQASSGTTGSVVAVTAQNPTNPLYTFSAVPLAGTLNGLVTIKTDSIPLQVASNPVVPVLINIPSPGPDLTGVLAAINAFSNPADVTNAVAQLNPSTPALAAPLVTFQGTRQFQDLWVSRLDSVLCEETGQPDEKRSICRGDDKRSGWWLKGFGYAGDQGNQNNIAGYDSTILGTMAGYDVPVGPGTRAGLGIGYAKSTIDGKTFDTSTDSNSYQATAYIGHEQGPWFVNGNASIGLNDYSGMRHIVFTGVDRTANASYSGQDYTAFANTGYHFPAQKFTITPLASLQYTHVNLNAYNETGAGDINLNVQSQSYNFLESGLGVKVGRDFSYRDNAYAPDIHVKWLHELSNPTLQQNAVFAAAGSSSFNTRGTKTANDTLNLGAGITLLSCSCSAKTWSLEAGYDYYRSNDGYSANQGMIRLSRRF